MKAALELHKDIFQGLQSIDAFSQDMFLPEELDLHLNRMQDSFVNELLDGGFADRQLRLDYIQDVIVKNKELTVFTSPEGFYYESGAVNSFLPGDYKHLLATRVAVREAKDCEVVEEVTISKAFSYTYLPLKTNLTVGPYYSKVELIKIAVDQTEAVLASVSSPVEEVADTYNIVRNLLFKANKKVKSLEIYWEKYTGSGIQGDIIENTFIFLDEDSTNKYRLDVYKTDDSLDYSASPNASVIDKFETWDTTFLDTLEVAKITNSTLLDNKELYERKQNTFFFPKPSNPHVLLSDGLIFTYYGDTFIPASILIDYIREPQPISLNANQGCELSISASNIIVNRVVEYLKLAIENPTYRETLQYNEIRDQK